ncbi:MAG: hypothetical protein HY287_07650 [Planctomycetes bacterium]|nr:hypothetical protein [Planctomycetota bacterium]MBI3834185.1 hypothetical protein [Planctomycetota bacterium]
MDSLRQNRKTLYVVTALYVVVGFILAAASAVQGDRLGTFLGFIIISGAIAIAVVLRILLMLTGVMAGLDSTVSRLRSRVDQLHVRVGELAAAVANSMANAGNATSGMGSGSTEVLNAAAERSELLDLAAVGRGDPAALTAATLDRHAYPRLLRTMEHEPPPAGDGIAPASPPAPALRLLAEDHHSEANGGASTRNLLRTWKKALRDGDLAACREVYSAMVDTADAIELLPLKAQLEDLADRTEAPLRKAFVELVKSCDYVGALAIGEQICCLLGDRAIAAEFERLRPFLRRKLNQSRPMVAMSESASS